MGQSRFPTPLASWLLADLDLQQAADQQQNHACHNPYYNHFNLNTTRSIFRPVSSALLQNTLEQVLIHS